MIRLLLITILILCQQIMYFAPRAEAASLSAQTAYRTAKGLLEANQPEEALDSITEALNGGIETPQLYQLQAEAFFLIGAIDDSLKALTAYEKLWRLEKKVQP